MVSTIILGVGIVIILILLGVYCELENNWVPIWAAISIFTLTFLLCLSMAPTTEKFCEKHNIDSFVFI